MTCPWGQPFGEQDALMLASHGLTLEDAIAAEIALGD